MRYRADKLGYSKLHMYDLHVPVIAQSDKKVEYSEAKEIVLAALKPMGEDYLSLRSI